MKYRVHLLQTGYEIHLHQIRFQKNKFRMPLNQREIPSLQGGGIVTGDGINPNHCLSSLQQGFT